MHCISLQVENSWLFRVRICLLEIEGRKRRTYSDAPFRTALWTETKRFSLRALVSPFSEIMGKVQNCSHY